MNKQCTHCGLQADGIACYPICPACKVKKLPCHVCGVLIDKEELDENGAYTYPDNKPHCPEHYPEEE